jgi:hypothetical protein
MMSEDVSQKDWKLWEHFVQTHENFARSGEALLAEDFAQSSKAFLAKGDDRVAILRRAFRGGYGKHTAVYILPWVPINELEQLFDELIRLAGEYTGYFLTVHTAILRIPKEWLLEHIEREVEPYLQKCDGVEYGIYLSLFHKIDIELAKKYALRALEQEDYDIREVGQDYLDTLNADKKE